MAINPLIPLAGRPLDTAGSAFKLTGLRQNDRQFQQRQALLEKQSGASTEIARDRNAIARETLELRKAESGFKRLDDRDKARTRSVVIGSAELLAQIESGGVEGGMAFLQTRKTELERQAALGAVLDTRETDRGLEQLQSDPDGLIAGLRGNVALGEQLGFLEPPKEPVKFQTDTGKAIADVALAEEMFGVDSPQAAALREAGENPGEKAKLTDVAGLRKEFTALSKDFIKVRDAFGKVRKAAENPSAAGDLSLIFNFMKMLDPGSVVRESEFATAQNAAGVPDRVRNLYNRALSGERLGEEQRADFVAQSGNIFQSVSVAQKNLETTFTGIATRQGFDPNNVVVDFVTDFGVTQQEVSAMSDDEILKSLGL